MMIGPAVRLVRPLRSGGMGSVWVAEHMGLKTQVAVKFLTASLSHDPQSVARFQREATAASQVKSPHVVQTFDHGVTEEGVPYIVMELLEGEDLTKRLAAVGGVLEPWLAARIIEQVAKALTRAHEKGIVHRDIKPDNIFVVDTGYADEVFVKLLDFGVAKHDDLGPKSQTATGSVLGTPFYMSPEQAVDPRNIDYRSDLWSLGMVAFELLTGRRAVEADSLGALVLALHDRRIARPSQFNPSLSPDIDRWFDIACASKPRDRFQSARELAEALLMITGDRAPQRRGFEPPSAPDPSPKPLPHLGPPPDLDVNDSPRTPRPATKSQPAIPVETRDAIDFDGGDAPIELEHESEPAPKANDPQWASLVDRGNRTPAPEVPVSSHAPRRNTGRMAPVTAPPMFVSTPPPPPPATMPPVLYAVFVGVLLATGGAMYAKGPKVLAKVFPSLYATSPNPAHEGRLARRGRAASWRTGAVLAC